MRVRLLGILVILFLVCWLSKVEAVPVYMNVAHDGYTGNAYDDDTYTSPFESATILADTETTQWDTDSSGDLSVGDMFTDKGHAVWKGLSFIVDQGDNEGLNSGWIVTFTWDNLTGTTLGVTEDPTPDRKFQTIEYESGTLNFYFKQSYLAPGLGNTTRLTDDSSLIGQGIHFMTIEITGGTGTNTYELSSGNYLEGSAQLYGKVTYLEPDYIYLYPSGVDLNTYVMLNLVLAEANQNTQADLIEQTNLGQDGELYTVYSRHDGSMSLTIVPEPATILLLGGGLLAVAFVARKSYSK